VIETNTVSESLSSVNFATSSVTPTSGLTQEIPFITTSTSSDFSSSVSTSSQIITPNTLIGSFITDPVFFSTFTLSGVSFSDVVIPVIETSSVFPSSFTVSGTILDLTEVPVKTTIPVSTSSFLVIGQNVSLDLPTPLEDTVGIINNIEFLINRGDLTQNDGDKLIDKLEKTIAGLEKGQDQRACKQLDQFIKVANRFIEKGNLSELNGLILIDFAEMIQANLNCRNG